MKILFICCSYSEIFKTKLLKHSKVTISNAPNVFQSSIIDGLISNNIEFEVISAPSIGCFPKKFSKCFVTNCEYTYKNAKIGSQIGFINVPFIKTISIRINIKKAVCKWINKNCITSSDRFAVLVYTPESCFIKPLIDLKRYYPKMIISSIVTDLIDDVYNFASNKSIFKRIYFSIENEKVKQNYKHINKYILLSKYMEEKIIESIGKNIVLEGIYIPKEIIKEEKKDTTRILLYTGTLEEFSGIRNLIDAFRQTINKDYRLIICGSGTLIDYIIKASKMDSRIIFLGMVSHEEATRLQGSATALINPRQPNGGITKYSFPSKTMEYLASGTPMIGYKLEGIPFEYYEYMFSLDNNSIESLRDLINEVLTLNQEQLDLIGAKARLFILSKKSSNHQVKRIYDFITS